MITNYKSFATTRNREVAELSLAILAAAGDQWERRVRGEDQPIGRLEWVGPCSHHYHHYTKDFWIMDITRYVVHV